MLNSVYINPPLEPEGKYLFWQPPRQYANQKQQLTDEQVFRTKERHSDFDILKLIEDREAALQFYRWKRHIEKHISLDITSPGDVLQASTDAFDRQCYPPRGICSHPIPQVTLQHLQDTTRPNPLSSELRSKLENSERFTLKLEKRLGISDLQHVNTRVHLCRIETVDDQPIENCPQLVLKIFDDRFMEMINPYDEDGVMDDYENITSYLSFSSFLTAEWHVRGELTAYEKMKVAQGSIIPYFYGAHEVKSSSLELY